jgi:hypothetical protein
MAVNSFITLALWTKSLERHHDTQQNGIQHNDTQDKIINSTRLSINGTQHNATDHYAGCRIIYCYAECRYVECHHSECRCSLSESIHNKKISNWTKLKTKWNQNVTPRDQFSGLYYKTITIVIITIVSDATIWSVTYDRNRQH